MIAYLLLEIRIEGAHSLKDKRQVVRSVKDGLRNHFNVAVAEVDASEAWQRATLGVVSISDSRDYLDGPDAQRRASRHEGRQQCRRRGYRFLFGLSPRSGIRRKINRRTVIVITAKCPDWRML